MKRLYLLRHANAAHPSGMEDEARPLSVKGQQQAKYIGSLMQTQHIEPDLWLVSAAKRTMETCKRVLRNSQYETTPIFDKALYLASAGEMIAYLNKITGNPKSIIIVGHNPGIEQLVKNLCHQQGNPHALQTLSLGYPPATLTVIDLEIDSWEALEPNQGTLNDVFLAKH